MKQVCIVCSCHCWSFCSYCIIFPKYIYRDFECSSTENIGLKEKAQTRENNKHTRKPKTRNDKQQTQRQQKSAKKQQLRKKQVLDVSCFLCVFSCSYSFYFFLVILPVEFFGESVFAHELFGSPPLVWPAIADQRKTCSSAPEESWEIAMFLLCLYHEKCWQKKCWTFGFSSVESMHVNVF